MSSAVLAPDDTSIRLTEAEKQLFFAIEAGETAMFCPTPNDAPPHTINLLKKKPTIEIRASMIRRLLFGLPVLVGREAQPSIVKFTDYGLRLSGVRIAGPLELDDSACFIHDPPRLEFLHCWFDEPIYLRRSRLKSLTLAKSYFCELLATDSVIDGPVDISFARSSKAAGRPQCWAVLAGARIAGRVNVARSHFMAPAKRNNHEWVQDSKHPRYALDLRSVQVLGSVQIRPDVVAEGGVCLTLAQVEGSVWCNGATLTGIEDSAFAADYASIKGSVYMRPYEHPLPPPPPSDASAKPALHTDDSSESYESIPIASKELEATGSISLFAARIGGSVYLGGAKLRPQPTVAQASEDERIVFEASNALIGGHCSLNCWRPNLAGQPIYRFRAAGIISLESARINADLTFSGAHVEEIQAKNLYVGGECRMTVHKPADHEHRYSFRATKSVTLNGAVIKGTLKMNGAKIGAFPGAIEDPNTADIGVNFLPSLPANLEALDPSTRPNKDHGLFAMSLNVGGNCELSTELFTPKEDSQTKTACRFQCFGRVVMREAAIQNSFRMDGATIVGPEESATVDLAGAAIGGQTTFMLFSKEHPYPFELVGGKTAIRLIGSTIGNKLVFNGASLNCQGIALSASNLKVDGRASFSTYGGHRFSAHGQVQLSSSSMKLGLTMLGAKLDSSRLAPAKPCLDLSLANVKAIKLKKSDDGFPFEASGEVCLKGAEIESDVEITCASFNAPLNLERVHVRSSLTLENLQFTSDPARTRGSLEQHRGRQPEVVYLAMRAARVLGELRLDGINIVGGDPTDRIVVDLRSARVEELHDSGGNGWGRRVLLWLEGFSYTRLGEVARRQSGRSLRKYCRRISHPTWLADEAEGAAPLNIWETRLRWLHLQYFTAGKPQEREFQPASYEQVVSSFNSTGSFHDARRINSAKLSDGSKERERLSRLSMWLFRLFFDFGLSGNRAVITFVLCLALGTLAVYVANGEWEVWPGFRPVLVAHLAAPQALVGKDLKEGTVLHVKDSHEIFSSSRDLPCGDRIKPLLYALDVFIPVLDLRQQEACSISTDAVFWRYGQALYALIGWIFTPLMFLSVTGILRRHLEK